MVNALHVVFLRTVYHHAFIAIIFSKEKKKSHKNSDTSLSSIVLNKKAFLNELKLRKDYTY